MNLIFNLEVEEKKYHRYRIVYKIVFVLPTSSQNNIGDLAIQKIFQVRESENMRRQEKSEDLNTERE